MASTSPFLEGQGTQTALSRSLPPAHSDPLSDPTIPGNFSAVAGAGCPPALLSPWGLWPSVQQFFLLAKGHNVAPSGHSTQAVVLRPTKREKFPGGWKEGYLNLPRETAGTLPEWSGPGEQLGCVATASATSTASAASSSGIVGMVGTDARMRGRAQ